jgi:iron complex transport system ATP-binding protein
MGRAPHLGFFEVPNERDKEVVHDVLRQLGLSKIAHRKMPSISGGEKRLVSIARALAQESDILIMDEPTAHLDLGNRATVLSIIREMANSGKTIFFSTHDPNEASLVADHVIIMNGGEVISEGTPTKAITRKVLEKIWGIPIVICNVNDRPIISLNTLIG